VRLVSLLIALVLAVPASADDTWTPVGDGWSRYTNERYGTVIEVPLHLFKVATPPPANGDGREFVSKDGARLWVYGSFAPYVVTKGFDEYKSWLLDQQNDLHITYRADGKGWIVLSGLKGPDIAYSKVIEGCEAGHHLSIEYPASKKKLYDPIVTRMARSLRCRPGLDASAH
jgi:hypothetical protein